MCFTFFPVWGVDVDARGLQLICPPYGLEQNWSDGPFETAVRTWYWGRERVGPFSVVWFDMLPAGHGTEVVSGYVAVGMEVAVSVRPWKDGWQLLIRQCVRMCRMGFRVFIGLGWRWM